MRNFLLNISIIFSMALSGILFSGFFIVNEIIINRKDLLIAFLFSVMLGLVAAWLEKRGWW